MMEISSKLKNYTLDKYEKSLVENSSFVKEKNSNEKIFFQCIGDHFFLHLYSEVIKNHSDSKIYGKIEVPILINSLDIILVIPFILKKLSNLLLVRKWKKLYRSIGVDHFVGPSISIFNFINSIKLFFKVRSIDDLNNLHLDKIYVGDLIIDTVIRFRKSKLPTINNTRSIDLIYYYYLCINYISFYSQISKLNFSKAFISQSVFIFHGIPIRTLFSKTKTYTSASLECLFKEIKYPNDNGTPYAQEYNSIFIKKNYSNKEIQLGLKKFQDRFDGKDDLGWLNSLGEHPYTNKQKEFNINIDGVLFLHDFYDGPHFYGKTIFPDFYRWTIHTLKLIKDNNLNIGIKLHPFQSEQSKKICEKLKSEFSELKWIDNVSNSKLFNSGIKFGITQHGTVITELAYHGVKPIYCANHPSQYFKIGFKASTKTQYDSFILNHENLKFDPNYMEEIGKFYFMHHLHYKNDYEIANSNGITIKDIKDRFFYDTKDLELIHH